jgi:trans-2-enoyl-CoA reductase
MADTYTRDEIEALYPYGAVNVQVDDDVRPMTNEEWSAWIDAQVGAEKPLEEPPA